MDRGDIRTNGELTHTHTHTQDMSIHTCHEQQDVNIDHAPCDTCHVHKLILLSTHTHVHVRHSPYTIVS